MKLKESEADISKAIRDYLSAERIWWMRCNSGMTVLKDGNGKRRMIAGHKPGTADILCAPILQTPMATQDRTFRTVVPIPVFLWLEVKTDKGKQSPAQMEFQSQVEAEEHVYRIVRSVDDVIAVLRELGVR